MSQQMSGVPLILQTMLKQLATNNVINNWNIYENHLGQVCLNIRFDVESGRPLDVGDTQSNDGLLNTQYKKVSPKQKARNINRAQQHKRKMMTRSKTSAEPDDEMEMARSFESDNDSLSSISVDTVISNSPKVSPQILSPSLSTYTEYQSSIPHFVPSSITSVTSSSPDVCIMPAADINVQMNSMDTASQTNVEFDTKCMQATPSTMSRNSQTRVIKYKHKYSQKYQHSDSICVQAGNGTLSTTDVPVQVDPITCENKSSEITPDLGTYHQKHSQTQFLCPGSEHDPYFDSYWIGRHCNIFSYRYASMYARQSPREPLYKCDLCNIVVCRNCKDESAHDAMCMQSFTLFRRNAGVNVLQIQN